MVDIQTLASYRDRLFFLYEYPWPCDLQEQILICLRNVRPGMHF